MFAATGSVPRNRRGPRRPDASMAETAMTPASADTLARGSLVGVIARQRELSLLSSCSSSARA